MSLYRLGLSLLVLLLVAPASTAQIRLGIVGTDTSHVVAFTQILNDPNHPEHVAGARVVAAWKGGSPDIEASYSRVDRFAQELQQKWGVELVPDIPTLCRKVDGVLLESVDGRVHLEQARQIIQEGKPLFIDKPLAATFEDALEIARLAKKAGVPWWSSSSLRFVDWVQNLARYGSASTGVTVWGPGPFEPHHYLELSWYAIHPIEILFTIMGPGCEVVQRLSGESADVVVGRWKDGRVGSVHALRPYGPYGATVFAGRTAHQSPAETKHSYRGLVEQIVRFFQTKQPPVPNDITLEIFAFMDAAQKSKEKGGVPVRIASWQID